jgi:hypothetical protein
MWMSAKCELQRCAGNIAKKWTKTIGALRFVLDIDNSMFSPVS